MYLTRRALQSTRQMASLIPGSLYVWHIHTVPRRWIFPKYAFLPHSIGCKHLCPALKCSSEWAPCDYLGFVLITHLTLQARDCLRAPEAPGSNPLCVTAQDDVLPMTFFLPPSPFQPGEGQHPSEFVLRPSRL